MKLLDALEILHRPPAADASSFSVSLACGVEPLHLRTFLAAELITRLPRARVEVACDTLDDLLGNVARAGRSGADAIAVVIEWTDIDPRLGFRRLGGWSVSDIPDIAEVTVAQLERLEHELASASGAKPIVVCPPTLPLPPLFVERPVQSGAQELRLRGAVAGFAERLGRDGGVTVCSLQRLDESSPPACRRDVRAELSAGFPYSVTHASAVAASLATLIAGPTPKKGLITDLDDTLWAGIAGEVGAENVSWSLDSASQRYGLYQQVLASLASAGVLIGVATCNDPAVVAETLGRADLLIPADVMFPVEAGWGPKPDSIERILGTWNVAPDAVVVVDDDPLELAAARDAFPGIEALQPPGDDESLWRFLVRLRELFGKDTVTDEDRLRLRSIRSASVFGDRARSSEARHEDFLARAHGAIEFTDGDTVSNRALELINKTNQFNLNGERRTAAALGRALGEGRRLITASYEDRYGPLGTVVALVVARAANELAIDTWVMSCRAFSRRLEFHCLRYLFDHVEVDEIKLAYRRTDRNAPVGELLSTLTGTIPEGPVLLTRKAFDERAPALVHRVTEASR